MQESNSWLNGSNQPDKAKDIVNFLEKRSQYSDQIQINNFLKDVINPKDGENILEVGSGSGVLCRIMAKNLSPNGHITGIDISSEIIKLSSTLVQDTNYKDLITFETGTASQMEYPDSSYDCVFAARLFLYLENPAEIVREIIRVTKPKGRIVLMDWDFETLVVDHPNRELTRKIFHWRNDNKDGNNWSGRQLFRLLKSGGLNSIKIFPIVSIVTDEENSLTQSLWHAASGALENGIISREEYDSWIYILKSRINNQEFFASIVYFIVRGDKI